MITRIVKMTFKAEHTSQFANVFKQKKSLIANFEGCRGVKLLRDTANPQIFFTYSVWTDAAALENYRQSELFQITWAEVKKYFDDKPEAWSVEEME
jgi:(4S)-4-hydroxy-5-phosphonooxypentane-2,3-dione isomerase